jgi:hypothetical protein
MGVSIYQFENYSQQLTLDVFGGISPVKTEPQVLRAISELISAQVFTQQLVQQLAAAQIGRAATGQSFISQGQRPSEGRAFDDAAEPVRMLTQRLEELEKRLDETMPKKAATATR